MNGTDLPAVQRPVGWCCESWFLTLLEQIWSGGLNLRGLVSPGKNGDYVQVSSHFAHQQHILPRQAKTPRSAKLSLHKCAPASAQHRARQTAASKSHVAAPPSMLLITGEAKELDWKCVRGTRHSVGLGLIRFCGAGSPAPGYYTLVRDATLRQAPGEGRPDSSESP